MAQLDQLDFKLFLEANSVGEPGQVCQDLYKHGVTTITQFAGLSVETLLKWGIADDDVDDVCDKALPHAQELVRYSSHDLDAIRQQLLVRARMHYMYVCTIAE